MKSKIVSGTIIIFIMFFSACSQKPENKPEQKTDVKEFMGQWTLAISGGTVGWLEVKQEDGYLDANLLWKFGSVLPAPYVYMAGNTLYVGHGTRNVNRERKYDGDESSVMRYPDWLAVQMDGDNIKGYNLLAKTDGTGVDSVSFTGTKLPPVPPAPDLSSLKFGKPITLFNGKDMSGWETINPNGKNSFHVENGVLYKDPVHRQSYARLGHGFCFRGAGLL